MIPFGLYVPDIRVRLLGYCSVSCSPTSYPGVSFSPVSRFALSPPSSRGVLEFVPPSPSSWSVPVNRRKWDARTKCNIYYYRSNYVLVALVSLLAILATRPWSVLPLAWCVMMALATNDTFARSLATQSSKIMRQISPEMAVRMRARGMGGFKPGEGNRIPILIFGVPRNTFLAVGGAMGAVWLWYSGVVSRLLLGVGLGVGLVLLHASFRKQNLKAKFESAKSAFTTAWQEAASDYNL